MDKSDYSLALMDTYFQALGLDRGSYEITDIYEDCFDLKISLTLTVPECICPHCGKKSTKIKTTYIRTIEHLPFGNKRCYLKIKVRCFKCENPDCSHKSFSEPISFVDKWQRRSTDLNSKLLINTINLGFSAACRISEFEHIDVSVSALRRLFSRVELPEPENLDFIGVDDAALRKGISYLTNVCDGKTHEPLKLFKGRTEESLAPFLQENPQIKMVARDRATAYSSAVEKNLTDCTQVADRFHLKKNLNDYLEQLLRKLPKTFFFRNEKLLESDEALSIIKDKKIDFRKLSGQEKQKVILDIKTCYENLPGGKKKRFKALESIFGLTAKALKSNLNCSMEEIIALTGVPVHPSETPDLDNYQNLSVLSRKEVTYELLRKREKSDKLSAALKQIIEQFPIAGFSLKAVNDFSDALESPDPEKMKDFIKTYAQGPLKSFAKGLKNDLEAVLNTVVFKEVSSGFMEGNNNKLKLLKRRGYGRYSLGTLEKIFRLSFQFNHGCFNFSLNPVSDKI